MCGFEHRRSQGGKGAMVLPRFFKNIVILCLRSAFSKQNSVIRLKSNICPPQNFYAGYATGFEVRILIT